MNQTNNTNQNNPVKENELKVETAENSNVKAETNATTNNEKNANKDNNNNQQQTGNSQDQQAQTLSQEKINELIAKAARADEYWDKLLRKTAELDNFRKRMLKERQELIETANLGLVQKLIPLLDNFDAAIASINSADDQKLESIKKGVQMVLSQFQNILKEAGVEEINATNQPFNPHIHEAISEQESTEIPAGHVIQQIRKGYKLKGRLIRPASVIVAKEPPLNQK